MKKAILTPNPYRDKNFQTVREAARVLKDAGMEVRLCLPFEVDKSYELPKDLKFSRLDRELPSASLVVCFGGDGTILHSSKIATRHHVPILGVNMGTMGFMAELESIKENVVPSEILLVVVAVQHPQIICKRSLKIYVSNGNIYRIGDIWHRGNLGIAQRR